MIGRLLEWRQPDRAEIVAPELPTPKRIGIAEVHMPRNFESQQRKPQFVELIQKSFGTSCAVSMINRRVTPFAQATKNFLVGESCAAGHYNGISRRKQSL